jgi:hypothetical protein
MRILIDRFPIGTKVTKITGKQFKSKQFVNTISGYIEHPNKINPITGKGVPACTFEEDDSIVEASILTDEINAKFKTKHGAIFKLNEENGQYEKYERNYIFI